MTPTLEQENKIQVLKEENSELQNKVSRIKANFAALQSINSTMNAEIADQNVEISELNKQITGNEQQITELLIDIANLMNLSEKISFYHMLHVNLRYVQGLPLPVKGLIIGGTVYKIFGNKNVKEDEQESVSPAKTFVLTQNANPEIEKLAPEVNTKSYQKVVEVSAAPQIQEIKIPNSGIWLPF